MKFAIKSVFVSIGVVIVGSVASFASGPSTTIASPSDNSVNSSSQFTISGTYTASTPVTAVRVVVCQLSTQKRCTQYVQDTNGTLVTPWRAIDAALSPSSDGLSGNYSVTMTNMPAGNYQIAVFAADQTTSKGDRTIVTTSVKTMTLPATGTGYITVMWGRTNWQATMAPSCTVTPGTRTLEQNAQDLQARGLFGVGGVVVNRTDETQRTCFNNYTIQPSWNDLANLRDTYGWSFVSQGMNYVDMTQMTTDEQRYEESGATVPIFDAHGHTRAWGAFNYANNKQDAASQAIVSHYFAFGRLYGTGTNTQLAASNSPYAMSTNSVNGGRCNNAALPCYNMTVTNSRRTTSPVTLAKVLSPKANEWGVVQFYRLVEDKRGKIGDSFAWDCSSPNWQDRWTSQPELYCRNSFLYALDNRTTAAQPADPATVAEAWNALPSNR